MRYRLLMDAQVKIAYRWRRYYKKCQLELRELKEQKRLVEEREKRLKKKVSMGGSSSTKATLSQQPKSSTFTSTVINK